MQKHPIVSIIYDRKHKANQNRAASVEIRVSYNYKKAYFSTGVLVKPQEWRNGKVVKRLDMKDLNEKIENIFNDISEQCNEMVQTRCFTLDNLRAAIDESYKPHSPLWEWIAERIDERPLKETTKRQHHNCMDILQGFGIIRNWSDVTPANLKLIDERLRNNGLSQVTIYGYHKRFKPYLRDAVLFGLLAVSPYNRFRTPKGHSKRMRYLTEDECRRLEAAAMPTAALEHAKDVWLYQRYTGLAYADLIALTPDNYVEQNGNLYILTERQKNGSQVAIRLIDKAVALLKKYDGHLPIVNISTYNMQLKQVALLAGINKPLTSHMARHTFATQALHKGVPIEVVSKMLSHSDIQTTQIYAKVLAEDVEKGYDMIDK